MVTYVRSPEEIEAFLKLAGKYNLRKLDLGDVVITRFMRKPTQVVHREEPEEPEPPTDPLQAKREYYEIALNRPVGDQELSLYPEVR